MKPLDAKIHWSFEYANQPTLQLLVDKIPDTNDMRYEYKDNCYFAEKDSYVKFFYYERPGNGYGGAKIPIVLKDRASKILIGPWSSGSYAMNKLFRPSLDVHIIDKPDDFNRGYTFIAGHVTLEFASKAVLKYLPDVELIKVYDGYNEPRDTFQWIPVLKDSQCEHKIIGSNNRCVECNHHVYVDYLDGYKERKK